VLQRAVSLARAEPLPPPRAAQLAALRISCLDGAAQELQKNLVSVRNGRERGLQEAQVSSAERSAERSAAQSAVQRAGQS